MEEGLHSWRIYLPFKLLEGSREARWLEPGLMIERLRVRIPAEAAGEISPPESTLCADS